jgi:hypothetical protein
MTGFARYTRLISATCQSRQFDDVSATSAFTQIAAVYRTSRDFAFVPIVLQKSFCLTDRKFSGL